MRFEAKILSDLMSDMMRYVRIDLKDRFDNIQKPFFNYDTMHFFMQDLDQKGSNSLDKFPVIYMRPDFIEDYNTDDPKMLYNANVEMYIINYTSPNDFIEDRIENVFRPVLYPIYNALINNLKYYSKLKFEPTHSKQDLPYWGQNNENFANEYIDAIHITNMRIGVFKNNC